MLRQTIVKHFHDINKVPESNHAEVLTISHLHITPQVMDDIMLIKMGEKLNNDIDLIPIFNHGENSTFMFINKTEVHSLPKCLADAILFARDNGYQWLAIDKKADTIKELPTYDNLGL